MPESNVYETDETGQSSDSAFFQPHQLQLLRKQGNLGNVNSFGHPSRLMVGSRGPELRRIPAPSSQVDKRELKEFGGRDSPPLGGLCRG